MSDLVKMNGANKYPSPVEFPAWHQVAGGYVVYAKSREDFDALSDQILGKLATQSAFGARPWTDAYPFEIPIRRLA